MTPETPAARPVVLLFAEPLLRMTLTDFGEDAGCQVVEVDTVAEAIRALEARSDIRVAVADLDARGAPVGVELVALIRDRWPGVELLLTGTFRPEPEAMPARGQFFDKPFDQRRFTRALQHLAGITAPQPALSL